MDTQEPIITGKYKNSISRYGRMLVGRWLLRQWWVAAIVIAGLLVAFAYDWRIAMAIIALSMAVLPMVMAHVYYYYALSPESARQASLKQTATFDHQGISIRYWGEDDEAMPVEPMRVPWEQVSEMEIDGGVLTAWLADGADGQLQAVAVPVSAFGQPRDAEKAKSMFETRAVAGNG